MPQMEALLWLHIFITSELLLLVVMCKLYYMYYKDLTPRKKVVSVKRVYWLW